MNKKYIKIQLCIIYVSYYIIYVGMYSMYSRYVGLLYLIKTKIKTILFHYLKLNKR